MAVDADDHLCRLLMFRFNFSEMRLLQKQPICIPVPVTFFSVRHR